MLAFWSASDSENSSNPTLETGHHISPWSCHKKYCKLGESETKVSCGSGWQELEVRAGRDLAPSGGSEEGLFHSSSIAAGGGCQALAFVWFPSTSVAVSCGFLPNVSRSLSKFLSDKDKGHWTPVHWIQQALILKVITSEEILFPSSVIFKSTRD